MVLRKGTRTAVCSVKGTVLVRLSKQGYLYEGLFTAVSRGARTVADRGVPFLARVARRGTLVRWPIEVYPLLHG